MKETRRMRRRPLSGHVSTQWTILRAPPLHSKSGATKIPLPVALDSRDSWVPLSLSISLAPIVAASHGASANPVQSAPNNLCIHRSPSSCARIVGEIPYLSFKIPLKSAVALFLFLTSEEGPVWSFFLPSSRSFIYEFRNAMYFRRSR